MLPMMVVSQARMNLTSLQFPAEFFNIVNHPNFRNPSDSVFNSRGHPSRNIGRIDDTTNGPWQVQ